VTSPVATEALLTRVLPAARLGSAADCRRFTVDGVVPSAVVFPESAAELMDTLRSTTEAGLRVLPVGLGAHLVIGMPPPALDCALCTERLTRVVEHAAADMTVTVEAGATLEAVNETLAAAGQWLPIDPPAPHRTTIGGLVSANLSGPVRLSQGTVRDLLLGLRAARADGSAIASGGRVVKNVAGYDLHKAFVGAHGTLGVVLEATFKVRPRAPSMAAVVMRCPALADAGALVGAIREAALDPLWLAVASADVLPDCAAQKMRHEEQGCAVTVGLAGSNRAVAAQRDCLATLVRRHASGGESLVCHDGYGPGTSPSGGIYQRLRDFPATADGAVVVTVMLLPTDVPGYIETAAAESRAAGMRTRYVADAGVARVHMTLDGGGDTSDPAVVADLVRRLRALAAIRQGHLTIRAADPEVKRRAGVWGDPGPAAALMRRLRRTFDPRVLLSAGRFLD
jgi:glycolate oxidase FAD binding subunit